MKEAGVQFHEGIPGTDHLKSWLLKGGLLVLDDLMAEEVKTKLLELLDLFTKHSHHQNVTVLCLCQDMFPPEKYAKSISRNAHYTIALKNLRDQLGMRNFLLRAFPTCLQDMMVVCQKLTEKPFEYMALDVHPGSDDRKRVLVTCCARKKSALVWGKERGCLIIDQNGILTITSIGSFEARCLGWRSTRETRPWVIIQQIFFSL